MKIPKEYKLTAMRDCPMPPTFKTCDTPDRVADYWRTHIPSHPYYNPDVESAFVMLLTARRHVKGHVLISTGTLDTLLIHPREVFRSAIVGAASAIIIGHNHPGGDPTPSEADIKVTRDLIRAGQLLKIEVLDHIIMGSKQLGWKNDYVSLRELGYFYS